MGITKTQSFTQKQNNIAQIAKALGHPARIAILEYLAKQSGCICNDIVNELPLAQATISQHLKELKSANLIRGTIEGTAINYCINEETFQLVSTYLEKLVINNKSKSCC